MTYYAGIGARKTPKSKCQWMTTIGYILGCSGLTLRSGAADGADSAFEKGCIAAGGLKEIYLPWRRFNNHDSEMSRPTDDAMLMAAEFHPGWSNLKYGAQKLHARNCHQILGANLDTPVDFVICWSPGRGGTEQALRIADHHKIPILNLAILPSGATLLSVISGIQDRLHNDMPEFWKWKNEK